MREIPRSRRDRRHGVPLPRRTGYRDFLAQSVRRRRIRSPASNRGSWKTASTRRSESLPEYVPARPILEDVDRFDAGFFGMHAREAALTDPQQRIFLECAWEALEDGGHDPSRYGGAIGVFAGASMNTYFLRNVCQDRATIEDFTNSFQVGNYPDAGRRRRFHRDPHGLQTRPARARGVDEYRLLDVARRDRSGVSEPDALPVRHGARRRGIDQLPATARLPASGRRHGVRATGIAAPSMRPRAERFSAAASASSCCGGWKTRCSTAIASTRSSAARRSTTTAPARSASRRQASTARRRSSRPLRRSRAYRHARSVTWNATAPARRLATRSRWPRWHRFSAPKREETSFCALGSVKTNIGHLDAAAGVAGLIKTALALHHSRLPATLHFQRPNPRLGLDGSPFYVNAALTDWTAGPVPRRAGVSALGVGGTNAHAVLEEAPRSWSGRRGVPGSGPDGFGAWRGTASRRMRRSGGASAGPSRATVGRRRVHSANRPARLLAPVRGRLRRSRIRHRRAGSDHHQTDGRARAGAARRIHVPRSGRAISRHGADALRARAGVPRRDR